MSAREARVLPRPLRRRVCPEPGATPCPAPHSRRPLLAPIRSAPTGLAPSRRGPTAAPPPVLAPGTISRRSEEHTSELQSRGHLVCRLLLENKNNPTMHWDIIALIFALITHTVVTLGVMEFAIQNGYMCLVDVAYMN